MAKSIELCESFEGAIKQAFKHSFTNFASRFFGGFFSLVSWKKNDV